MLSKILTLLLLASNYYVLIPTAVLANSYSEIQSLQKRCSEEPHARRCPVRGEIVPWHQANVPYILSPRSTRLLDRTPTLSWWNISLGNGEVSYDLVIEDNDGNIVSEASDFTGSTFEVKGELEPGRYRFFITENSSGVSSSRERPIPNGIGFDIATDDERMEIMAGQEDIQQRISDPVEQQLAIGELLIKKGFFTEGVEYWESLPTEAQTTEIMLNIADVYWSQILNVHSAEEYYQKALELADADSIFSAEAMVGLAQSAQVLSDFDLALQWLEKAQEIYKLRGRRDDLKFVERLISEVQELLVQ